MDVFHRKIIKDKGSIIAKSVCLNKLEPFLKEYKIFNKNMWEDIKSTSDVFDMLPYRGPEAYRNIIEILRKAGYNKEADILENLNLTTDFLNKDLYHKMSSKPLGYCLIINNVDFKDSKVNESLEYRHGSDVDAKSLRTFFKSVDFDVITETNLKAGEMIDCIANFANRDFMAVDSMILIILSHGGCLENRDFIYGTDGGKVFKEKIYNFFSNENCEDLQNKPKIFFFIACRGKGRDYGVPQRIHKESIDSAVVPVVVASLTDIYICHSTLPYNVSIRDHEKGSFFCETLVNVLNQYHRKYDLETVIQFVNSKLQNKVSNVYRNIQVAHYESFGGTKKVMLCRTN